MRYLSVCSGIEAATVAWQPLGWEAVAYSEIEAFPSAVLAYHYPETPNWGDMTAFEEWPDADVDVLAGGTPCQSFSVAGLRAGLDDPRGNLMLTYLAIAAKYRPRWVVWENVPGVLSSNGGRDFGAFLRGLGECGYGWCYRVLDAQYFGLAQRRRRVFVVGHLGDWRPAAAVLLERESLQGNPAPRREAGESAAPTLSSRTHGGGGLGTDTECDGGLIAEKAGALQATYGKGYGTQEIAGDLIPETSPALKARDYKGPSSDGDGDGDGAPILPCITGDKTHALTGEGFDASEDGTGRGTPVVAFDARQSDVIQYGDMSGPLDTDGHSVATQHGMAVRRLTPRECERLQGFPDDYTLIPYRGKPAADGPRYKALGNSWAVPCAAWIGRRIALFEDVRRELEAAA